LIKKIITCLLLCIFIIPSFAYAGDDDLPFPITLMETSHHESLNPNIGCTIECNVVCDCFEAQRIEINYY